MIDLAAKYEAEILDCVLAFLSEQLGVEIRATALPDRQDRVNEAVEMLAEGGSHRFAIEHTRLGTVENGIADDVLLQKRMVPLAETLDGHVPGWYELEIDARAILKVSTRNWPAAGAAIQKWVLSVAPTLDPQREFEEDGRDGNHSITATLPGVPFEVRLLRTSANGSIVIPARRMAESADLERNRVVQKAVDDKFPKLKTAAQEGREGVLVLETRDFQGQAAWLVASALRLALAGRTDVPDRIYLIETDHEEWTLWVLKDADGWLGDRPRPKNRGPHIVGRRPRQE